MNKTMRKTDKKIENQLRQSLTEVCHFALENIEGYQWITHKVNYDSFPDSLQIICAFLSQSDIDELKRSQQDRMLKKNIEAKLTSINIKLKNADKQITYTVA